MPTFKNSISLTLIAKPTYQNPSLVCRHTPFLQLLLHLLSLSLQLEKLLGLLLVPPEQFPRLALCESLSLGLATLVLHTHTQTHTRRNTPIQRERYKGERGGQAHPIVPQLFLNELCGGRGEKLLAGLAPLMTRHELFFS